MTEQNCRHEHDFVLILDGISELTDEIANALFEAGCDDATPSCSGGRVSLTFTREESSLKRAILSAIRDVKKAEIGAGVMAIDNGNLVSQADIARRIGKPRQMITQYLNGSRGPGHFPPPACHLSDTRPLWAWSEVSTWLYQNGVIDRRTVQDAEDIAIINAVLEMAHQRRLNPELAREVAELAIS